MKAETQATNLPLFPEDYRACGVLLHVTSLPSPYGFGDLGPSAFAWTDWLNKASQTWWQALPAGPTGYANSPYPAIDGARNQRENVWNYLKRRGESSEIAWELIRLAWSSVAALAMVPLQDVLNLGTDARMNLPSRVEGNWRWRYPEAMLSESVLERVRELQRLPAVFSRFLGREEQIGTSLKPKQDCKITTLNFDLTSLRCKRDKRHSYKHFTMSTMAIEANAE
jgi:4-alpha-glucanotransferase